MDREAGTGSPARTGGNHSCWSGSEGTEHALVPRTRSSHHNCRESDCELRVQSGTRIIDLLVSFDSEVRFGARGKFGRTSESGHWNQYFASAALIPKFADECAAN